MGEMRGRGNKEQNPNQGSEKQSGLGLVDVNHVFDDDGQEAESHQDK